MYYGQIVWQPTGCTVSMHQRAHHLSLSSIVSVHLVQPLIKTFRYIYSHTCKYTIIIIKSARSTLVLYSNYTTSHAIITNNNYVLLFSSHTVIFFFSVQLCFQWDYEVTVHRSSLHDVYIGNIQLQSLAKCITH